MKWPKQITGRFFFTVSREIAGNILALDGYKVGLYPLTYEIIDCLEHFCDGASWEVSTCHYHYEGLTSTDGTVTLLRPFKGRSFSNVFSVARALYREGLVL